MFSPTYRFNCEWKGHQIRIGSVLPQNKEQISNSLKDMSRETIRNRFLGSKKEFSKKELEYLTVLDGHNHYALGIEELQGHHRGIGLIRLVRSSENPEEGEVAITLIDDYQKMGLGKMLVKLMILAALERDFTRLSFTYLPQNTGIIKLIQSVGKPIQGAHSHDSVQMFLDLKKIDREMLEHELFLLIPDFKKEA